MRGGAMALRALIFALAVACGVRADDFPFKDCAENPAGIDPEKGEAPAATEGLDAVPGADRMIKVTLRGEYKGFRIHAMDAGGKLAEGKFTVDAAVKADVKMLTCEGKADSGVAHMDSTKDLKNLEFSWMPAESLEGKIKFKAIQIKAKDKFTKFMESGEVEVKKGTAANPDSPPGPPTEAAPTKKPTGASGRIDGQLQLMIAIALSCTALVARHQRWVFL